MKILFLLGLIVGMLNFFPAHSQIVKSNSKLVPSSETSIGASGSYTVPAGKFAKYYCYGYLAFCSTYPTAYTQTNALGPVQGELYAGDNITLSAQTSLSCTAAAGGNVTALATIDGQQVTLAIMSIQITTAGAAIGNFTAAPRCIITDYSL